jgi:hypothetical protein
MPAMVGMGCRSVVIKWDCMPAVMGFGKHASYDWNGQQVCCNKVGLYASCDGVWAACRL